MRLSADVGVPLVQAFESCLDPVTGAPGFFKPYRCPAGVLTIGWGHTNHHAPKFAASAVWSQEDCDRAFVADMAVFERHVAAQMGSALIRLSQGQFDALVSWSFNCGGPETSSVWPAARKAAASGQAKDAAAVAERLARWNKANGKVLAGLVRRRKAEGQLFMGDAAGALKTAGAQSRKPLPMPQVLDTPTPGLADAAKRCPIGSALTGAGTAAGTGATVQGVQDKPAPVPEPPPDATLPQPSPPPGYAPFGPPPQAGTAQPAAAPAIPQLDGWTLAGLCLAAAVLVVAGILIIRRRQRLLALDWA
ncbi:lysozyme [Blastochloris tepida]|uniref:Lysozyme n=1 Tax=Blastochloris tepida TaxID=2233851 RepID=A0A348G1G0_9HYPH|nr:lysozyme [Blastochloris tepida]BBF93393.1 hypothetical protein BLTE_20780 [Blastochloris tepida]